MSTLRVNTIQEADGTAFSRVLQVVQATKTDTTSKADETPAVSKMLRYLSSNNILPSLTSLVTPCLFKTIEFLY